MKLSPLKWILRCLAYVWASPYTIAGIAIGLILGGRFQRIDGVVEIFGPRIEKALGRMPMPAMAMTFGHVVFGVHAVALDVTRRHEAVHVKQYERWGPLFVPAYLAASAYLYARGRDGYRENPFEIEAYAVDTPDFSQRES
ncbi:hypothetical protein [Planctomycetes bacterium K23_9]|uniref:Signal peptide prediction n=1 Tax=Stieleria marina TaxID=1930275 RepID=A0A517NPE6_9BACT|nr:hypothetical protein K239x_09370 [Planctomycetes bacterium K23_9]